MQAYCLKCCKKKETKNAKAITMKKGKPLFDNYRIFIEREELVW